jgi:arabinan endo-1,5-alpha-L-arabinosidase
MRIGPGLALAVLLTGCVAARPIADAPGPTVALDMNFPDPAVLRATDGHYYAYATQG